MATFQWNGTGWTNTSTGRIGTPANGDSLVVPANTTATISGVDNNFAVYANIVEGANATIDVGTTGSPDPTTFRDFPVGNLFVGPGAVFTMTGQPNVVSLTPDNLLASNVVLEPGSTLNLGFRGQINNLANNGGTLNPDGTAATAATATLSTSTLRLGFIGFVQTGGFTPGESELNNSFGVTAIDLGNIMQGSAAAAVEAIINNAPAGGTFGFLSPDNAFTLTQGSLSATLGVSTSVLGTHTATLTYTAGGVHNMLTIADHIVAA